MKPRSRFARLFTGTAAMIVAAVFITACSSEPDWHPVSTEESQILALTRFNNFDTGSRPFTTEIVVEGAELTLQGWVDFEHHVGYAAVTGQDFEPQALLWWDNVVALGPTQPTPDGNPPLPLPVPSQDDGWLIRPFSSELSQLDAVLALLSALGVDRPENPLLLQQAGALWLGDETLETDDGNINVAVFATPPGEEALGPDDPEPTPQDSAVKLWVDETGVLHRTEALIGNQWVTINHGTADSPELSAQNLPAVHD